jgi:hypothetical protein
MSTARSRFESIALVAALILATAFLASAVYGVLHRPAHESAVVRQTTGSPPAPGPVRGRVEVLNASGRSGLARAATMQLRDAGFDVVYFATARANQDSSVVLDRIGNHGIAAAAASALSIATVREERDSTLLLDATVIVARDWRRRQVEQQTERAQGWKATIRRWLGRS